MLRQTGPKTTRNNTGGVRVGSHNLRRFTPQNRKQEQTGQRAWSNEEGIANLHQIIQNAMTRYSTDFDMEAMRQRLMAIRARRKF